MENLIEHILTGFAVLMASAAAWFARRAHKKQPRGQRKSEIVARGLATARKNPSKGVPLETTALEYSILIDMEDGKSDFRREELWAEVRAQLASEKK